MNSFQIIFMPVGTTDLAWMLKKFQPQILGDFRGLPQQVRATELDQFGKPEQRALG